MQVGGAGLGPVPRRLSAGCCRDLLSQRTLFRFRRLTRRQKLLNLLPVSNAQYNRRNDDDNKNRIHQCAPISPNEVFHRVAVKAISRCPM